MRSVVRRPWQPGGLRARGNDAFVEIDRLVIVELEPVRRVKPGGGAHDAHLARLREFRNAVGQAADDTRLPVVQGRCVDLRVS